MQIKIESIRMTTAQKITDATGETFDDDLTRFVVWWYGNGVKLPAVPIVDGLSWDNGVTGIVLFREGKYQVQLFIISPNCTISEHRHPNVDSYEIYLTGMTFTHRHKTMTTSEADKSSADGTAIGRGLIIRVKPNDMHGGVSSNSGGSFISIQKWLNDILPTSVGNDWIGHGEPRNVQLGQ